jgi:hypothetical protein
MNTRRKFLFDCSASVAALALAPIGVMAVPSRGIQSLEQLTYPALAAEVNTTFKVRPSSGQVVELTLLKAPLARPTPARPGGRPPGDAGHEKFSLIFSGPKNIPLESAIHRFEHSRLGRFEMSISEIGAVDQDCVRYEAVFNRPPSSKRTATPNFPT